MNRRDFIVVSCAGAAGMTLAGGARAGNWAPDQLASLTVNEPEIPRRDFNIADFGASADEYSDNTGAIAATISACVAGGGGRVVVPPGKWPTGPIKLQSNVDLHLADGSELVFSTEPSDYLPVVFTRWEGVECYNYSPLIYGRGLENVAITGSGVLNGRGEEWWDWKLTQGRAVDRLYSSGYESVPVEKRVFGTEDDALRPPLVQLVDCRRVLLSGYTCVDSPFWTNHLVYCEDILVDGVRVYAPALSPNTDGVNLDSTRNAIVRGIFADTGDDAVCVKSGRDEDAWRVGRPTENVIIEDCIVEKAHGGFVVGSEMSGGIRNVLVRNCDYRGGRRGIRLKSRRGRGGEVSNIWIENIRMGLMKEKAVNINLHYSPNSKVRNDEPPIFRDIHIRDVTCNLALRAVDIEGLPESPVKNLSLSDFDIKAITGLILREAEKVKMEDLKIRSKIGYSVRIHNSRDVSVNGVKHPIFKVIVTGRSENVEVE